MVRNCTFHLGFRYTTCSAYPYSPDLKMWIIRNNGDFMVFLQRWALLFLSILAFSHVVVFGSRSGVVSAWGSSSSVSYKNIILESSNLPIVVINTENGREIPDEPKLTAHMGIIYNGEGERNYLSGPYNEYDGCIGIERRGNASQNFPKKPYLLETRDEAGNDLNVSLLGMPNQNDWILRAAFLDKTLMRDVLGLRMSRSTARWASRTEFCEVVLNGEYVGVYILMESIRPDKNRVNIMQMDSADISGDAVTGGYIYEVSQSGLDFGKRRRLKYPKQKHVQPQQLVYIRKYDDYFRDVMTRSYYADSARGYPAWIDVDSFIDEILVHEACKNSDAYGWSSYFHKDRLGKLKAGPVFDFDQAFSNSTFNDGPNYQEWIIEKSAYDQILRNNHPPFWRKLFAEPGFRKKLGLRWFELRSGPFLTDSLLSFIDETAVCLDEAQTRNFQKWPILGVALWRSTPGWRQRSTYQKEVDYLRAFMNNRLDWMDAQLRPFIEDRAYLIPPHLSSG